MEYPSLLRRYLASAIDILAILFLFFLYSRSPLHGGDGTESATWPLWLLLAYEPVLNRYGTTLGQLLMRFRVRTISGNRRVPLWRGLIRLISKYLLGAISFLKMPVQKQRRALHDVISGTIALNVSTLQDQGTA